MYPKSRLQWGSVCKTALRHGTHERGVGIELHNELITNFAEMEGEGREGGGGGVSPTMTTPYTLTAPRDTAHQTE